MGGDRQRAPAPGDHGSRPQRRAPTAYRRPGLHPEAETVLLPAEKTAPGTPGTRPRHRAHPPDGQQERPRRTAASTQPLPPVIAPRAGPAGQDYQPSSRRTRFSRMVLLAILCMQAILSLRLHNTAFEDEALYLYSGHMELAHALQGARLYGGFAGYFSGAPVLYPVLGAALSMIGGLAAARAASLAVTLITTALLYSLTRRLVNERVALCAAAVFSVTPSVLFLGHLATYDAAALCLLAFASWVVVRTAAFRWPVYLLAAPVVALAVATKYASALFVPTIALLPAFAGWPQRGRRVLAYPFCFALAVAGLLAGALHVGGPAYLRGVAFTTTDRFTGTVPTTVLLRDFALWGALLFTLAVIGALCYTMRPQTEPGEQVAPPGGRWRRAALGALLTGTALLAPAEQIRIHTETSLSKHIGFGLFFAAPMAGAGVARIMGEHLRRAQAGVAVWGLAIVIGMVQSAILFGGWPNSDGFVRAFPAYLGPGAHYLVEVPEVPIYYLTGRPDAQPYQFTSTFVITYTGRPGQPLTGNAGFAAAIRDGYFQVVAYNGTTTPATDAVLARALQASGNYRLARVVLSASSYGRVPYYIWVKR